MTSDVEASVAASEERLKTFIAEEFANRDARITEERETVKRYFDIMVERVEDRVKIVTEGTAHHTSVLGDHEKRIRKLERPGPRRS